MSGRFKECMAAVVGIPSIFAALKLSEDAFAQVPSSEAAMKALNPDSQIAWVINSESEALSPYETIRLPRLEGVELTHSFAEQLVSSDQANPSTLFLVYNTVGRIAVLDSNEKKLDKFSLVYEVNLAEENQEQRIKLLHLQPGLAIQGLWETPIVTGDGWIVTANQLFREKEDGWSDRPSQLTFISTENGDSTNLELPILYENATEIDQNGVFLLDDPGELNQKYAAWTEVAYFQNNPREKKLGVALNVARFNLDRPIDEESLRWTTHPLTPELPQEQIDNFYRSKTDQDDFSELAWNRSLRLFFLNEQLYITYILPGLHVEKINDGRGRSYTETSRFFLQAVNLDEDGFGAMQHLQTMRGYIRKFEIETLPEEGIGYMALLKGGMDPETLLKQETLYTNTVKERDGKVELDNPEPFATTYDFMNNFHLQLQDADMGIQPVITAAAGNNALKFMPNTQIEPLTLPSDQAISGFSLAFMPEKNLVAVFRPDLETNPGNPPQIELYQPSDFGY